MTDKQINEAIAEACGWVPNCDGGICWDQHGAPLITPPNYCNDLNAMHEAEMVLTLEQQYDYWSDVKAINGSGPDQLFTTARQRAEAFLKTLGKWEEAQK